MDPLSDVLSLLKPRSYRTVALDAGGDWAIQFHKHEGLKFQAVISGAAWLAASYCRTAHRQAGCGANRRPGCCASGLRRHRYRCPFDAR